MAMVGRLVPDGLWELFQRVVPAAPVRPQGGGRCRYGDREVLAAILFVATMGPGGNCHRSSACPGRPRTGGSPSGAGPGYGASFTAWSWTNSVRVVSWTGPGAPSTP